VGGAPDDASAAQVARTIAGSMLVKTAVHGADANWGRIAAAAGRAGVPFDPARMSISLGAVPLLRPGYLAELDEEAARLELLKEEVVIHVDLGAGKGKAAVHGCDLSDAYVRINASYRS
jgi:glutamate N-acetyltransferase/amino-acid N-acetyltransferase